MKRFHVHVSVADLATSIRFYSTVFGTTPTVEKSDYAKWMIEDPRINFAISRRGRKAGVNHLGIQVDSDEELAQLRQQVASANVVPIDQTNAACCYAVGNKYWLTDPQGVAWETYHTMDNIEIFGDDSITEVMTKAAACCAPADAIAEKPSHA